MTGPPTRAPEVVGDVSASQEGPYGPRVMAMLPPARRILLRFNRWLAVPLLEAGLGFLFAIPFGGWIMVLRTTGRRSGRPRSAGLCYAIADGAVYTMAGFGPTTHWLRNLEAEPAVEVLLPSGAAFAGRAEVVSDAAEYVRAFRALDRAMFGVVAPGTLVGRGAADEDVAGAARWFPIVRIRPTGIAAGPADPGGAGHLLLDGVLALAALAWLWRRRTRREP